MTAAVLRQLVAGLAFLHQEAELVYRDLEDKHVGQCVGRDGKVQACLFDLSTCVGKGTAASHVQYAGESS